MYEALKSAHSGLRWVVIAFIIWAIYNAFMAKGFNKREKLVNLFSVVSVHTQLILGFILYVKSPKVQFFDGWMKDSLYRFYGMEHLLGMFIAVVLITIGYSKSKRANTAAEKFKPIKIFYLIGLIIILASIPWPFRANLGGAWF